MELTDLVGLHWLSGVKRVRLDEPETDERECRCIVWLEIDCKCYCVAWHDAHGHSIVDMPIHDSPIPFPGNRFPPLQVVGSMDDSIQRRMLYFLDVINGNRILSIGRDCMANGHFTAAFQPELASKNLMISDGQLSPRYPGNWVIAEHPATTSADGDPELAYSAEVYETPDGCQIVRVGMERTGRQHAMYLKRDDWEKLDSRGRSKLVEQAWAGLEDK